MHRLLFPICLLLAGTAWAATPITTRPLAEVLIYPERSAPATVESLNDADLSAEITARIERILVRVGDEVAAGDALVELDCRDYRSRLAAQQAALRQLEAQHRLAASQLERARNLRARRGASQEEVEQRETELLALDAQLASQREAITQAERNVGRCTIRAPYRAAVTARLGDQGTLATPGMHLLRIVQTDALELSAQLRADEVQDIRSAASLAFDVQGERHPVELRRTVPVIDPRTRTVELRLDFPARSPLPGAQEGQPVAIDLPPDTRIVVAGRERLGDGAAVSAGE